MSPPDYLISTPENVDLHLELAGIGNRIWACLIDTLLSYAIILIIVLATTILITSLAILPIKGGAHGFIIFAIIGITLLLILTVHFGYFIFFEGTWQGQSPGKKIAGIRVIEQNGQPASWSAVLIRNLLRVVDTGLLLIGLLFIIYEPRERRIGDLAGGTLVIRERGSSTSRIILPSGAQQNIDTTIDVGRISPQEYDLLKAFLGRREQLAAGERPLIARRLLEHLCQKLDSHPGNDEAPEKFLEKIYCTYQSKADIDTI